MEDVEKVGHKNVKKVVYDVVYCDDCGYYFYYEAEMLRKVVVSYYKILYKNAESKRVAEFPTCNELIIKDIIE
jgi:hypothetical protein